MARCCAGRRARFARLASAFGRALSARAVARTQWRDLALSRAVERCRIGAPVLLFALQSSARVTTPWFPRTYSHPETGAIVFGDAEIWLRQEGAPLAPHLLRRDGSEIELELERHPLSDERSARGGIERHRPVRPLAPGTYTLRLVAPPNPLQARRAPRDRTFRVQRGAEPKPPALPR